MNIDLIEVKGNSIGDSIPVMRQHGAEMAGLIIDRNLKLTTVGDLHQLSS
jgi:hypothetical protein